jgi:uncharacterized membrane protein
MNPLLTAGALGAVSGSRSMLAPALVARAVGSSPYAPILSLFAAGEMAADKMPFIPARTDALPLVGRVASGAMVGAALTKGNRAAGALAGAAGALAASYALVAARRYAAAWRIPNAVAGACEDALALAAGMWALRRA